MMEWKNCRKILCVRADNMGDVIMSGPAIRSIKNFTGAHITLLTSSMGSVIAPHMPAIDATIVYDLPWVKNSCCADADKCFDLIHQLRQQQFDAAIIFTVYSQNPLPTALLLYLAGIPLRVAYCRENPYGLLTHWLPDEEPYTFIQHQVQRDISLAIFIGAKAEDDNLMLLTPRTNEKNIIQQLIAIGVNTDANFIIAHPGVSDEKRKYPSKLWIDALQHLHGNTNTQVIITGTTNEVSEASEIQQACGAWCVNACGVFNIEELVTLIKIAPLLISVNTGTVHIAVAVKTPVVVLYAQTNPQHTPWKTPAVVLPFHVNENLQSKNQVIQYVHQKLYTEYAPYPSPQEVADATMQLLEQMPSFV